MLWVSVLMSCADGLRAQNRPNQFDFQHIKERDGISLNITTSFVQDHDGFLWMGTFDGLNRYDGQHFVTFKRKKNDPTSLLSNTVNDVCEDHNGNIWVAGNKGISCYDKTTGRFRNIKSIAGRNLNTCFNIYCDRTGDIWFASYYAGLYRYIMKTGVIQFFPFNPRDTPQTISSRIFTHSIVQDPHQNGLWIADKKQGVQYFDIGRQRFGLPPQHTYLKAHTQHYVTALTIDGDRLIFGDATDNRVVVYDLRKQKLIRSFPLVSKTGRDAFDLFTIFVDRQHNLWIGCTDGLMFFAEANTYRLTEFFHDKLNPGSMGANSFLSGWQHPDGSVWLGTTASGISYINLERSFYTAYPLGTHFQYLKQNHIIVSHTEASDGSWWFGTHLASLMQYWPKTGQLSMYNLPVDWIDPLHTRSFDTVFQHGNSLYAGSQNGLFAFNLSTKRFAQIPLPDTLTRNKDIGRVFVVYNHRIWCYGSTKMVFCYTIATKQWQRYTLPSATTDPKFRVRQSLFDREGNLWLDLYPDGFAHFSEKTGQFTIDRAHQNEEIGLMMTSFAKDSSGYFWMTSLGNGLVRYDPRRKEYKVWDESDGLASDRSWVALADKQGDIWVSCANKFSVFRPADSSFATISMLQNQIDINFPNRLFPLRSGHILALLEDFLIDIDPEKRLQLPSARVDNVLVSRVDVGDTTYLIHRGVESIRVGADDKSFTVFFGVITTGKDAPYQYQYQLEGYDKSHRQTAQPFAAYNRLPGGNYRFTVKAIAPDGHQTAVRSLMLHIDSYFYETSWFKVLLALILLGLAGIFYRYRTGQTRAFHQLQVQATRLERDKTTIQYQNLINHLNPHFLFNSLTSLNSLIITRPKEASVFLRKLSIIYRYILQNKDKELVSLQDELTFTQHYIDLQTTRFGDGLQISVNVPDDKLDTQIVPVTIQNLLENAIKHNSLGEETPLLIRIYTDQDTLYVMNNLQKKGFVETSNKQGLSSLQSLYHYLSEREVKILETTTHFTVAIPLL